MPTDPLEVYTRFSQEQKRIAEYVEFVIDIAEVRDTHIRALNSTLRRAGFAELPRREDKSRKDALGPPELSAIVKAMEVIRPKVNEVMVDHIGKLSRIIERWKTANHTEHNALVEKLRGYASDLLAKGYGEQEMLEVENELFELVHEEAADVNEDQLRKVIKDVMVAIMDESTTDSVEDLSYISKRFNHITFVSRFSAPDAEINIHRQSFILLMTAFDAAVTDLAREALKTNFFGLIPSFADKEALPLKEMGKSKDFGDFSGMLIDRTLKGYYARDILHVLLDVGLELVDKSQGHKFVTLIELIRRRNLHVHNRGVVDAKYLDVDENGKSKSNLYNLHLGQVAEIDAEYLDRTNKLCGHCIKTIADWVAAGAGFYGHKSKART